MDKLTSKYILVSWAYANIWLDNPNNHDIGQLAASFIRHGVKKSSHFDETLGAIDDGNGRVTTLNMMELQGQPRPRGIIPDDNGKWMMSIAFGVNSESLEEAIAYTFDANNTQFSGDGLTAIDASKKYDNESYIETLKLLAESGNLPLTVDGDDLDTMIDYYNNLGLDGDFGADEVNHEGEVVKDIDKPLMIHIEVNEFTMDLYNQAIAIVKSLPPKARHEALFSAIDLDLLSSFV